MRRLKEAAKAMKQPIAVKRFDAQNTNPRIVIMAAGNSTRWKNHMGIPKQLAPVKGEPVIKRTIRLLKARGVRDIWVTVKHKGQYGDLGVNEYIPNDNTYEIDRLYSSRELAPATWLYGDVYYTEGAIDTILWDRHSYHFFGTYNEGKHPEIYAIKADTFVIEKARELRRLVQKKVVGRAIGLTLHKYVEGGAITGRRVKPVSPMRYFTEINDGTDDFDDAAEYKDLMRRLKVTPKRYRTPIWKGKHDITEFKNLHKGERCFIIGTGPSLNDTNLALLKNEICFGVNSLNTSMDRLGLTCKYYCISDPVEWKRHSAASINDIKSRALLFGRLRGADVVVRGGAGRVYNGVFSTDPSTTPLAVGGTVVISMVLQLVYYMGFTEVYLLGCDCDKSGPQKHVDGKKERPGRIAMLRKMRPSNPEFTNNWGYVFKSYEVCKEIFEADGRKIINCTVGGKLEVFERKSLEEVCGT